MKDFMVRDCECCKQFFRIYFKDIDTKKLYRYCTECEKHPKPVVKWGNGLYQHDDSVLNGSASHYESERWRREDEEQIKRREFER